MSPSLSTLHAYNTYADLFDEKFAWFFEHYGSTFADIFLRELSGDKVLDVGAGAGNAAAYFAARGLDVTCFDISPAMVEHCRARGVDAVVADMETYAYPKEAYDGIWAHTSLLHVPRTSLPTLLAAFADALGPCGVVGVVMLEGEGEGDVLGESTPGVTRFFSYVTDGEMRALLAERFTVLVASRTEVGDKTFLNFLARKTA